MGLPHWKEVCEGVWGKQILLGEETRIALFAATQDGRRRLRGSQARDWKTQTYDFLLTRIALRLRSLLESHPIPSFVPCQFFYGERMSVLPRVV